MEINLVFIVTCYQNVVNVYSSQDDAAQCQRELIAKNRPADIICRSVVQPLNSTKNGK